MGLILVSIFFGAFIVDVLLGAFANASVLSDVQQMIVLFATSIAFVSVILKRERDSKK